MLWERKKIAAVFSTDNYLKNLLTLIYLKMGAYEEKVFNIERKKILSRTGNDGKTLNNSEKT